MSLHITSLVGTAFSELYFDTKFTPAVKLQISRRINFPMFLMQLRRIVISLISVSNLQITIDSKFYREVFFLILRLIFYIS